MNFMPKPIERLRIMVVDDDVAVRTATTQMLSLAGFIVEPHASAETALESLREFFPGILLVDFKLASMEAIALLEKAISIDPNLPVIMISRQGDVAVAVRAMRAGAFDFLEKQTANDTLLNVVAQAMEKRRRGFEVGELRKKLERKTGIESRLIGESAAIAGLRNSILKLSDVAPDVLIHGETGSGKEVVARALHDCSPLRKGPFVAINCGAIPEAMFESELFGHEKGAFTGAETLRIGKIEYASGGTLFLDEVEALPMALQVKLLRVLQFRQIERLGSNRSISVPVRVIAATKEDLKLASDAGRFRSDLYFRFNIVALSIPPLRDRRDDIPQLFEHHVMLSAARYKREAPTVSKELMLDLMSYDWPGNVRELGNVADRFVLGLLGNRFHPVASGKLSPGTLKDDVGAFERDLIAYTLRKHQGNVEPVSKILGLPKRTLYDKMRRYALTGDNFR